MPRKIKIDILATDREPELLSLILGSEDSLKAFAGFDLNFCHIHQTEVVSQKPETAIPMKTLPPFPKLAAEKK